MNVMQLAPIPALVPALGAALGALVLSASCQAPGPEISLSSDPFAKVRLLFDS